MKSSRRRRRCIRRSRTRSRSRRFKLKFPSRLKTSSTFFPKGTMAKKASCIVKISKNKKYAPKGVGSAIRFIQYYINRNKKRLKKSNQLNELKKAKKILQVYNNKSNKRRSRRTFGMDDDSISTATTVVLEGNDPQAGDRRVSIEDLFYRLQNQEKLKKKLVARGRKNKRKRR